jgi:hypothetical protein
LEARLKGLQQEVTIVHDARIAALFEQLAQQQRELSHLSEGVTHLVKHTGQLTDGFAEAAAGFVHVEAAIKAHTSQIRWLIDQIRWLTDQIVEMVSLLKQCSQSSLKHTQDATEQGAMLNQLIKQLKWHHSRLEKVEEADILAALILHPPGGPEDVPDN